MKFAEHAYRECRVRQARQIVQTDHALQGTVRGLAADTQAANPMADHLVGGFLEGRVGIDADRTVVDQIANRNVEGIRRDGFEREIPVGDDAHDAAALENGDESDVFPLHQFGHFQDGGFGATCVDVGVHQISDAHGSLLGFQGRVHGVRPHGSGKGRRVGLC